MSNNRSTLSFSSDESFSYADLDLSVIFIIEHMINMESDLVKVYIYFLFLNKYNKKAAISEISKKLNFGVDQINQFIDKLQTLGLIEFKNNKVELIDLKEKEAKKICDLKSNKLLPINTLNISKNREKREQVISVINEMFFQGMMSSTWYRDIDVWFEIYRFDEDVMYTLFQHCYDRKALAKNYIMKVAENWKSKNITNSLQLDNYYMSYQKVKLVGQKISKKLRLCRNLTEYEEEYLESWVIEYGYDFDVIELALKLTRTKTNPSFQYLHKVLTDWNSKSFKNHQDVLNYLNKTSANSESRKVAGVKSIKHVLSSVGDGSSIPQHLNFSQTQFDEDDYSDLFDNAQSKKTSAN